jgi:hypothetical protein
MPDATRRLKGWICSIQASHLRRQVFFSQNHRDCFERLQSPRHGQHSNRETAVVLQVLLRGIGTLSMYGVDVRTYLAIALRVIPNPAGWPPGGRTRTAHTQRRCFPCPPSQVVNKMKSWCLGTALCISTQTTREEEGLSAHANNGPAHCTVHHVVIVHRRYFCWGGCPPARSRQR